MTSLWLVPVSGIAFLAQVALTKGRVEEARTGEPLTDVPVQLKGTEKDTIAVADGSFNLPVERCSI